MSCTATRTRCSCSCPAGAHPVDASAVLPAFQPAELLHSAEMIQDIVNATDSSVCRHLRIIATA